MKPLTPRSYLTYPHLPHPPRVRSVRHHLRRGRAGGHLLRAARPRPRQLQAPRLVMPGRRFAVTGRGVVSSCGTGVDAFWDGLNGPAPEGERRVHDFDPAPLFDNPKEARRADRVTQLEIGRAHV